MAERENRLELDEIKLAGFKSFVDPTSVKLPSNLASIVGPNGCGKSNIIDAVRWVMGESSAKYLRGESMADVIFNGSTDRKPLGQASVELVFNNPNGAIGGEYAHYEKISIRRTVTRDGQSNYFLNNARCRRRDITDIFLGTGLGPRSYAIIGQGTISRIIEARPEELRVYLEEAAGISKYKERRRETENSIRHTRENLERLSDIREELEKQLNRLERQAEAAEKYKTLKEQERVYKAQLLALRWQSLDTAINELEVSRRSYAVELEAALSEQQELATDIEKQRQLFTEANDAFSQIQGRYYDAGGRVSRLEQTIQHNKERQGQLQGDLAEAEEQLQNQQTQWQETKQRLAEVEAKLKELTPTLEELRERELEASEVLAAAEENRANWQQKWDLFSQESAEASQQAQVQQTQIRHLEQTTEQAQKKIASLEEEQSRYRFDELESQIEELRTFIETFEEQKLNAKENLEQTITKIRQHRQLIDEKQHDLDDIRSQLQKGRGRQASLQALQQAALGQDNSTVSWLEQHGLDKQQRLAQLLTVEPGWEKASEVVLGQHLQAVCVDDLDPMTSLLSDFHSGEINFFVAGSGAATENQHPLVSLSSKIKADCDLSHVLAGIFVVDELTTALSQRNQLASHESIVTKDGIWLSKTWLRVIKEKDSNAGILQREKDLNALNEEIAQLESRLESTEAAFRESKEQLLALEELREEQQREANQSQQNLGDKQAQLRIRENRLEQFRQRLSELVEEISEHRQTIEQNQLHLDEARSLWQQAMTAMELHADKRESLSAEKDLLQDKLIEAKHDATALKDQLQQLMIEYNSLQTEYTTKQGFQDTMQQQVEAISQRRIHLQESLAQATNPNEELQLELEEALEKHLQLEETATEAKVKVQQIEHLLRESESKRQNMEEGIQAKRSAVEKANLDYQGFQVRRSTVVEQLEEEEQELQPLLDTMPEDAEEKQWEMQIQQLGNRIQRLGAINLAAIEEYDAQSERKIYLDKQNDDLTEALEVLEEAIAKIDEETRQKFKETYDFVNTRFKALFPKVFNGGSAGLELTGEDLLDTGVTVMARPPGKRNTTIHLLSGGEKALTAVALVFSIFHLNPAPFCMLDEVDAPLDDSNVMRFCNLLREMSTEVQFLYISHNKVAIEMAEHLIGVTMKEAGVSRLVTVDMEEAMAMADA